MAAVGASMKDCPGPRELHDFWLGRLSQPALEAVADHLSDCPRCEEVLSEVRRNKDAVVANLQNCRTGALSGETPWDRLEERARALVPGPGEADALLATTPALPRWHG